jgi:hypothetical protein
MKLLHLFWMASLLAACGPMATAPTSSPIVSTNPATETPAPVSVIYTSKVTEPAMEIQTPTAVLPTSLPQQPDSGIWTDVPMDSSASTPPIFLFQVQFDTSRWQFSMDSTDTTSNQYSLEHRIVQGCNIEKTVGRGLPPDWSVKKTFRVLGSAQFGIVYVSDQHQLRFINYCTSVGENSEICFAINVQANQQECIDDGEKVIETFTLIKNPYLKSP